MWDRENKVLVSFQFLISEFQFLVGTQNFYLSQALDPTKNILSHSITKLQVCHLSYSKKKWCCNIIGCSVSLYQRMMIVSLRCH